MGTENESALMNGTLYLNGEPVVIGELPEITVPADEPGPGRILADPSLEMTFTFTWKTPKRWRCRNRKRFIKLMMSEGISRNGAVWLADFIRKMMPYKEAWRKYFLHDTWIITAD